jgi:hypothetical protein
MKKDFDFEQVGKKLPYKAPESYIETFKPNFRRNTLRKSNKVTLRLFVYAAASVALLIVSSLIFINPGNRGNILNDTTEADAFAGIKSDDFDAIFKNLTDEELTTLSVILDSDMFEN